MTTLQSLDREITQTIEKYVEYDCLNTGERDRKRSRGENVEHIRELCFINGVRSIEYIEFYYLKLKERKK